MVTKQFNIGSAKQFYLKGQCMSRLIENEGGWGVFDCSIVCKAL